MTQTGRLALEVALAMCGAQVLEAQGRGLELGYGRWWYPTPSTALSAAVYRPLLGPLDYSIGVSYLDDSRALDDRTQTAGELGVGLGRDGRGLYAVGAAQLGVRHRDRNVDAAWSAGLGYALPLLPFISLGFEARYRVEDREVQGFWRLDPADRRGFLVQGRILLGASGVRRSAGGRGPSRGPTPAFDPPRHPELLAAARRTSSTDEVARLAADVVKTALDAMGAPYRWGGSGDNGYDCSGLIQFAYGEHGILLPRVSRDQVRMGVLVEKDPAALRPGDILGFAGSGGGVNHVGLYVGDGLFIHSAGEGVKLSSLTAADGESRHWRQRWLVARRILN